MSTVVVEQQLLGECELFRRVLTPEVKILESLFNKYNYEIRIAGGAVRDLLMGKCPADVDFATTATPDQMKEMFTKENIRMINALGEKHGTITARINDVENFEVTTLRIDKVTDGRRAEVEFTKDWMLDANRRDLTINSMFLGLDGTLYDYFNGREDLKARRVRFVGDPVSRIQEDYLRILRYFRFYGRIAESNNDYDEETIKAIRDNVKGMEIISGERIWTEWRKILAGKFAGDLTLKMVDVGLGPYIGLPKDPNVDEFTQVWKRSENLGITLEPQTLLSGLLRDQKEVMDLHGRLKLSGLERDTCLFVVTHRESKPHPEAIRPYQYLFVDSKHKPNDTKLFITETLKYRGDVELVKKFTEWVPPKFPVTGYHLKENGCPSGKVMSIVMGKLKDIWKESNFEIEVDDLVKRIPDILDGLSPTELNHAYGGKPGKQSKRK